MSGKEKIALYGLGTETERIIPELEKEYEVICLLDGFKTEGVLFGKKILSLDTAIGRGISRIIVVARPGSCKVIAKRIGDKCREFGVSLYDIRNNDLLNPIKKIYDIQKIEEILMNSSYNTEEADRVKLNLFLNRVAKTNIHETEYQINDVYDIGYLVCAPLITDFTLWIYCQIIESKIKNVWLSSRDGYLIKKLFAILDSKFDATYFLTSRSAAIRAGIQNEEDILYVDSMKFSGTSAENIKSRFGVIVDEGKNEEFGLLKYKELLLEKSKESKAGYLAYIERLNLKPGDVALFDFVAKGTNQYFVGKLIPNHIKGFYFLRMEPEFMKSKALDIVPFYLENEKNESVIFENYYILETILTAPEPSVVDFDSRGNPVYAEETRKKEEIECLGRIQEGIIDYFRDYINSTQAGKRRINKLYDEEFLKLINCVKITDEVFLGLKIEDPFFNRNTDITDIL